MPVTPWEALVEVSKMYALVRAHNRVHGREFSDWVDNHRDLTGKPYAGGRTSWFASDGTKYDLGGPSLVYVDTEN